MFVDNFAVPVTLGDIQGGTVGATHILSPYRQESFVCNLAAPIDAVAEQVAGRLEDRQKGARVAVNAARAARLYDSTNNAKQLMQLVQSLDAPTAPGSLQS